MRKLSAAIAWLMLFGLSAPSLAQEKKLTVGVFLPASVSDGQTRFSFAEAFAGALGTAMGRKASAKNFGRYEDFAKAMKDGSLDVAVVDAWVLSQMTAKFEPVAYAVQGGQTHIRWSVVGRTPGSVSNLTGKRLALSRAASDAKFLSNVIFAGDFEGAKKLKLVPVPTIESALKMVESKAAEAALVPTSSVPKGLSTLYRSPKLPLVSVVSLSGGMEELPTAVLNLGALAPFDRFVAAKPAEIAELQKVTAKGPPKRAPVMVDSPLVRPTAAVLTLKEVGVALPSFLESYTVSKEQPDD